MKKQMLFLAIALFALAGFVQAETILWVSDCVTETAPHDQGFIDLLEADGYTVTRMVGPQDMTVVKRDEANGYDLVILGRHGNSGSYDDTASDGSGIEEETLWNSITAPLINMNGYLTRNARFKNLDGANTNTTVDLKAIVPSDPIFGGVTLGEDDSIKFITNSTTIVNATDAGNGTMVAVRNFAGQEYTFIARWDAGVEFYNGAGQYAGGQRMAFHAGSSGGPGDGTLNLTAAGTLMFLNAVYEMSGATFDRAPLANAGPDQITNVSVAVQLDGSAYDAEGAVTITWSQVDGPATASIADASIEDPTVTFDTKGTYTLQVEVNDGLNAAATGTVTVYVRDPADNALFAHWDFDGLPDPNTLIDVTGNGFDGAWISNYNADPNVTSGVLEDGTSQAFDSSEDGYWEVLTAKGSDPNFSTLMTGATFAAWVKADAAGSTNYPVIIGDNSVGIGVNNGRFTLRANDTGGTDGNDDDTRGSRSPYDGQWHHVVGVFDGVNSEGRLYVDGVEDGYDDFAPGTLYPVDLEPLLIGTRPAGRPWPGQIDDIQVYNYPLGAAEIAALTGEGDVPLYITAGEDQVVNFKNQPVQLGGIAIVDDGKPVATNYLWELTNYPLGVDPAAITIVNDDPTTIDAEVIFPNPPLEGGYIFTVTADDTVSPQVDNVLVTIKIPTCADVLGDGLGSIMDVAGGLPDPEGNPTPDCYVDLQDFAVFAAEWMNCVNPSDPACVSPY